MGQSAEKWAGRVAVATVVAALTMSAIAAVPKARTVVDAQPRRKVLSEVLPRGGGSIRLTNLNPKVNAWLLLELKPTAKAKTALYNLVNTDPARQAVRLDPAFPRGLKLLSGGDDIACPLWSDGGRGALASARARQLPYVPLCGGRLALKSAGVGSSTLKEQAAEFLRDVVPGGERLVTLVKNRLFQDHDLITASASSSGKLGPLGAASAVVSGADREAADARSQGLKPPRPALVDLAAQKRGATILPKGRIGIALSPLPPRPGEKSERREAPKVMAAGRWYASAAQAGVWVSQTAANLVPASVLRSFPGRADRLDAVEQKALAVMIAFDLDAYSLGYGIGTEHPKLAWSPRAAQDVRGGASGGPDGYSSLWPLAAAGVVPPEQRADVVATFAAGFKRNHGAFKYGPLSRVHQGSHYGFIEDGVVLSKMQPGLATLLTTASGDVDLKTWTAEDDLRLSEVRYARQNGVPLVVPLAPADLPQAGPKNARVAGKPGQYVPQWGPGNWSGDVNSNKRTLRAGVCRQPALDGGKGYLLFGYFSAATPSAMARVFQAYGCTYAMHLDMNAPVHAYLALYGGNTGSGKGARPLQHLVTDMRGIDPVVGGHIVPRFLAAPDNRDFFFVYAR